MRVNLLGGPGSGKTTTAARVFSQLKEREFSIEYVTEYVKAWTYMNRNVKELDQIYIFSKQQQAEYNSISNGVKNIITDSPTFFCVCYSSLHDKPLSDAIWTLCELYDKRFPSYNIFIERMPEKYDNIGRYQTEEEAKNMDEVIWDLLVNHYPKEQYCRIPYKNKQEILDKVLEVCEK